MGLNVHGGPPGAAWLDDLAGRRVGRAALLEAWLRGIDRLLRDLHGVAARYRAECATVGRRVSVELAAGESVTGTAVAVDELGLLVVDGDDGTSRVLAVGDVTHLR